MISAKEFLKILGFDDESIDWGDPKEISGDEIEQMIKEIEANETPQPSNEK